ncbi:Oidioi.mRNA.OKI2018_I69.XSR.g15548.t1.cds [Oikopleura dioica]|uniref:Oidioi.mRNA.OKI2018_I69.XSR.g15548.t1.cds n=1 Tax=Oikopleura dioica TaxID=34765 RepID=A0ABN7SKM0_OIKDI|nr:Oidioi.mRNA.OKI2018_I69.XSR.g15548.t1.cds [Oikopleura dioica]
MTSNMDRDISAFFKEAAKLRQKHPQLDITMIVRRPDQKMPIVHKDNPTSNPIEKKKRSFEAEQCSILSFVERKKAKKDGDDIFAKTEDMEEEDLSVLDYANPFDTQSQSQQQSQQQGLESLDFANPFEDSQSQQSQDLFARDELDFDD